ncbi:hypothetical protein CCR75_000019 [Bremia lactucae]|uniref:DUF4211 domain-containing protein n=1 Tax=Bremia lactucae TaxID=4779 RepID=A0A976IJL4_BRELC|nr:hypothetical protein CCR75_000019 [Bremia lactucae]
MADHVEVVIDGDSTEDEDEVTIVTPESRKRRCRSNILLDQDEEDDDTKTTSDSAPRLQQQLSLNTDGLSLTNMKLRQPSTMPRSRRHMHQLSIAATVELGKRGHGQQTHETHEREEDDVRIIQPPSGISVEGEDQKHQDFIIEVSNEEKMKQRDEHNDLNGDQNKQEVSRVPQDASASRRSSRIECKRQEKRRQREGAPNLNSAVPTNCLASLQSLGPHYNGDVDDDHASESSDSGKQVLPPTKRRQSIPRLGERDHQEKGCVDAGDDVDDFICGDDEVEYMNDDEEAVISVESSDDDVCGDDPVELTAILAARRSREVHEWFEIYMEYLEECIIDPNFEMAMRHKRSKAKHYLYDQSISRIERKLCSCRDTVRSGVAWPEEMVEALKHASVFRSSQASAEQDCDACNRRQHVATHRIELTGYAFDATKLYSAQWMHYLKKAVKEAAAVNISFEMGSICHARTLAYWQLLHAKQFWCILIDAKLQKCADRSGRISDQYRVEFIKKEFGRYKKLVSLVDNFAEDSKRITQYMPNEWRKVTRRNIVSNFLPLPSRDLDIQSRRGTLESFVNESEEEPIEEEEEMMEQMERTGRVVASDRNHGDQTISDKEEESDTDTVSLYQTPCSKRKNELNFREAIQDEVKKKETQSDEANCFTEKDNDMCLVCDASPRNSGVVHGLYLHVYCCYACAKRQYRVKSGCMVCNRPIDQVLRLLPLTYDARKAIRNRPKKT